MKKNTNLWREPAAIRRVAEMRRDRVRCAEVHRDAHLDLVVAQIERAVRGAGERGVEL